VVNVSALLSLSLFLQTPHSSSVFETFRVKDLKSVSQSSSACDGGTPHFSAVVVENPASRWLCSGDVRILSWPYICKICV
jgi:hypothetical protein